MNAKQLMDLGIDPENIYCSVSKAVVHQVFSRKGITDYRNTAIDKLIEFAVRGGIDGFTSEVNTVVEMISRFVKVTCPLCAGEMIRSTSSGNGTTSSIGYKCKECAATVFIEVVMDGFSVRKNY